LTLVPLFVLGARVTSKRRASTPAAAAGIS
jgi:hypothetical protein